MREYYTISGYWKDDKSEFDNYLVTNFDDFEEDGVYDEDDIFLFGYSEDDLKDLMKVDNNDDFVIIEYTKIIQ